MPDQTPPARLTVPANLQVLPPFAHHGDPHIEVTIRASGVLLKHDATEWMRLALVQAAELVGDPRARVGAW